MGEGGRQHTRPCSLDSPLCPAPWSAGIGPGVWPRPDPRHTLKGSSHGVACPRFISQGQGRGGGLNLCAV